VNGQFLSRLTEIGHAKVSTHLGKLNLTLCRGNQAYRCPYVERGLYPLSADFYVIAHDLISTRRIVPVWCLFDADLSTLDTGLRCLEQKLGRISTADSIRPLVLIFDDSAQGLNFYDNRGSVVPLSFPLLNSFQKLEQVLLEQMAVH